jgi:competence protein ComEC
VRLHEPLLPLCAAFAAGIATASYQPISLSEACIAGAAMAALGVVGFVAGARRAGFAAGLGAMVFAGAAAVAAHPRSRAPELSVRDNVPAIFEGCVVDPALTATDRERFTLELAPGARAQVSLSARDGVFPVLPYGTHLEFQGKVRRTHNYNDPGAFDNVQYLARKHIYWTATADASTVHVLAGHCGNALPGLIYRVRAGGVERLDRLYANDPYADGMMQATLMGSNAKLDRMWTEDYRATGTYHALIISGTHLMVLSALFLFFLRLCAMPRSAAIVLTIVAAWFYAGVTGWSEPVLRSASGITLFGIGRYFFREGRLLNILAAIAIVFLVVDPDQISDAGFQLSFMAVALIGAFVAPILEATSAPLARGLADMGDLRKDVRLAPPTAQFRVEMRLLVRTIELVAHLPERVARFVVVFLARFCFFAWDMAVTSFFLQLGLALPMIVYFHRTTISGITANVVIVPLLGAVVPLGFLAIALKSAVLAHWAAGLLNLSRIAVGFHARWEPEWRIPAPPWWLGALFGVALIVAAWRKFPNWARVAGWIGVAASLAAIIIHPFAPVVERGRLELSAIDVGQGDSLLVGFPQGQLMLIDAGGIPSFGRVRKPGIDIGEDVVSPYLWSRSIRHLDVVALTHAHEDHMGGMSAVLRNFRPRELWTGATEDSPEWRTVRATAESLHIPIRQMKRGAPFAFGGATMQVLAPGPDYIPSDAPKNDDSLVMRIRFGATSFLLTGDMERPIERELAARGLLEHDDVLKVGHHGSRTSSTPEFLDLEKPAFGIISVGFDNSYGHPHPFVIHELEERRIAAFRTDQRGLITVVSDGRRLRFTKP